MNLGCQRKIWDVPATHDIGITRKDLAQTANHHIRKLRHFNIDKIPNRLINDNSEAILVCQSSDTSEVGTGK